MPSQSPESKYLDELATACPFCGDEQRIRRWMGNAVLVRPPDEMPYLKVGCYCAKCNREWTERYRLESVQLLPATGYGME